jgi:hypothetical protein
MADENNQSKSPTESSSAPGAAEAKETYSLQEYLDDLRKVFISPRKFMDARAAEGSLAKGFLFVFLCSLLGSIGFGLAARQYFSIPIFWVAGVVTNYMAGCLFHVVFKIFGGNAELSDSIRACNYTIAPCLFQGVPYVSTLAALYSAVLLVFGMRAAHKVSMLKASLLVGVLTAGFAAATTYLMHGNAVSAGPK